MKTITLLGRKGGITKTTLAINIAAGCARAGLRTVLIDADGQGNASALVGNAPHDAFYGLIAQNGDWADLLMSVEPSFHDGPGELWLLSSYDKHRLIEQAPETANAVYSRLSELGAMRWADVVIVDTSPAITEVHAGLYLASDYVLLPTLLDFPSILSLASTLGYLEEARAYGDESGYLVAKVLGIVPNCFNANETVQQENYGYLCDHYAGLRVFDPMRALTVWKQATQMQQSIFAYQPTDYRSRESRRRACKELLPVVNAVLAVTGAAPLDLKEEETDVSGQV